MLQMTFTSKNGTGTGEIDVVIGTVDGIPVGEMGHLLGHCLLRDVKPSQCKTIMLHYLGH